MFWLDFLKPLSFSKILYFVVIFTVKNNDLYITILFLWKLCYTYMYFNSLYTLDLTVFLHRTFISWQFSFSRHTVFILWLHFFFVSNHIQIFLLRLIVFFVYFGLFCLVLWHINLIGYLMQNPAFTYNL